MKIKTLSLIQPYATMINLGYKNIETRSWYTPYRGKLLIHTSKKLDLKVCEQEPFKNLLSKHYKDILDIPVGKVILSCDLVDCIKISEHNIPHDTLEYELGIYEPNRYMWVLNNVQPLKQPISAKGYPLLWHFDFLDSYM